VTSVKEWQVLPNIFLYLDYRAFLYDLYCAMHARNPKFTPTGFGRLFEDHTKNFLTDLLNRKIDIDPSTISSIAKKLELNAKQRDYFETLVSFDQAKSHEMKDRYFRRIISTREYGPVKELDKKQYQFFSHWYNPVVRELVTHPDFPDEPSWIAERIIPEISEQKVLDSIKLLVSLGLIVRDSGKGRWRQADRVISTPSEVMSIAVFRYQQDVIALGRKALERFNADQRDMRTVTMGIAQKAYPEVKKRVETFWKELLTYANTQDKVECVYQVNIQLFPLSKVESIDVAKTH